jgi:2Fe-2S ferredoxin
MPTVTFTLPNGTARTVDSTGCETLMHVVIKHDIAGIEAECGGQLICATCQVYVDAPWEAALPGPSGDEQDMIEDLAVEVRPESRLACQIRMTPVLDGLVVRVPVRQR